MNLIRDAMVSEAVSILPFSDEHIDDINLSSDFFLFLDFYGLYYVPDPLEEFQNHVQTFRLDKFPKYLSARIGRIIKYTFAIQWLVVLNPDEAGVHDFPYLVEIQNDIEYTILLAHKKQLKLSLQLLRNVLELIVIHLYFIYSGKTYDDIKNVIIPSMRRIKTGMLVQLINKQILGETEAAKIGELYGFLSSAVHSQFNFLHYRFEEYVESDHYWIWSENFCGVMEVILGILIHLCNRRSFN